MNHVVPMHEKIISARGNYNVMKFNNMLPPVDEICLEMGYNALASNLTHAIYAISTDESVRDDLFRHATRIMNVARNYRLANNP